MNVSPEVTMVVRTVIVDSNQLFGEALASSLSPIDDIANVGVGVSGDDAVFLSRVHQPQVMILGTETRGMPLELVLTAVRQYSPATRVILLSETDDPASASAADAYRLGAWTQMSTSETLTNLWESVRATQNAVRKSAPTSLQATRTLTASSTLLSRRELDVLELLAEGKQNPEIAALLNVTTATVKRHLANLYQKLSVHTRVEALRRGVALGILQLN
jgi:two-component system response regulator DesR